MSQLEEIQRCFPESHRKNTVLRDIGHRLQRVAHLHDLSSRLAQGLFSNSQHIIATNHQRVHSCSIPVSTWPNGSSPCSSLQCWHCQGLFILLLPNVSSKSFHCLLPPRPQRRGHLLFLVSVWEEETLMSILSMSHEYSYSVHRSSEKHICTACCRV